MSSPSVIPDIQSGKDHRNIEITRVGIRDIRIPFAFHSRSGVQHSVANAELTVSLPSDQKGTHMSRFIHLLNEQSTLAIGDLPRLHKTMLDALHADEGTIELSFPFFIRKSAPVSKVESLLDCDVVWAVDGQADDAEVSIQVSVPVTSLCPCSKEISQYGAHNQRSHIIITALFDLANPYEVEELIDIAEQAASCPMWSTLKRPDEKYVTERAYENPKFVEDIVRDVAVALNQDNRILAYRVSSENFESIHNHSAYAVIEYDKRDFDDY